MDCPERCSFARMLCRLDPALMAGLLFGAGRLQPSVSCPVKSAGLSADLRGVVRNLSDGRCRLASHPPSVDMRRRDAVALLGGAAAD